MRINGRLAGVEFEGPPVTIEAVNESRESLLGSFGTMGAIQMIVRHILDASRCIRCRDEISSGNKSRALNFSTDLGDMRSSRGSRGGARETSIAGPHDGAEINARIASSDIGCAAVTIRSPISCDLEFSFSLSEIEAIKGDFDAIW